MRRSLLILATVALSSWHLVSGYRCGRPLTTACLGDTDKRYDPDSSNDLLDQAPVWSKFGGYYRGVGSFTHNLPDSQTNYPVIVYANSTVTGSRIYHHRVIINIPLRFTQLSDAWSTSTYEKDGSVLFLGSYYGGSFISNIPNGTFYSNTQGELAYAVDVSTIFSGSLRSDGEFVTESNVFLDESFSQLRAINEVFRPGPNGSKDLVFNGALNFFRVTETEWIEGINADYDTYNIPESDRVPIPMVGQCLIGVCPSEADWCKQDPKCSESPYQEPSASLKPGAVAGFTVAGIVLLVAILVGLHFYLSAKQAKRYRTVFATRIAETINVQKSMRSLTPALLESEFKKIDSQTPDGRITKEELWEFISSGKAGEMNESDFNALFAAIDSDNSGYVDFLEFCTFMGKCHGEYSAARANRGNVIARTSLRLSSTGPTPGVVVEGDEEEKGED